MRSNLSALVGSAVLFGAVGQSCAADPENALFVGPAAIRFHVSSSDLAGPPGTTPPGAQISVDNTSTLGVVYSRSIGHGVAATLIAGQPPVLHFRGSGSAAPLGEVGSARVWFPALVLDYSPGTFGGARPFVGAGMHYTTFSQAQVNSTFTTAFGGTSSGVRLKSGLGFIWRLGVDVPIGQHWVIQASAAQYRIKTHAEVTTDTPGFGPIVRSLTLRSDPNVYALLVGYRF